MDKDHIWGIFIPLICLSLATENISQINSYFTIPLIFKKSYMDYGEFYNKNVQQFLTMSQWLIDATIWQAYWTMHSSSHAMCCPFGFVQASSLSWGNLTSAGISVDSEISAWLKARLLQEHTRPPCSLLGSHPPRASGTGPRAWQLCKGQ